MKIPELLAPIKERLDAADKWCQQMPEGYATKETGPKLCRCGAIGYPFEHKPPVDTDLAKLIKAVECLSEGYAEMLEHLCDSRSDLPCSQMWFQDVAEERIAQAEEILKCVK